MAERIVERVPVDVVHVGARHRAVDEKTVTGLVQSMGQIGLMQPITVRMGELVDSDGVVTETPILVAGHHRLTAARRLGWPDIEVFFVTGGDLDAELAEIDENLMRAELTPAQVAAHLARRKEIWEARRNSGATCTENQKRGRPQEFASDTAEKTGVNKSTVTRATARAAALGDDLNDIAGTSLDKGVELDALAKLAEPERKELIQRAKAGEQVSARKPVPVKDEADTLNDFEATQKQVNALIAAWNRAGPEARDKFREYIDNPVFDSARAA